MKKLILLLFGGACFTCAGQKIERVIIAHDDPYDLYANTDKDSTTLFYEKMVPGKNPVGVLVILPGSGEQPEDIRKQITLHNLAVKKTCWSSSPPSTGVQINILPSTSFLTQFSNRSFSNTRYPKINL